MVSTSSIAGLLPSAAAVAERWNCDACGVLIGGEEASVAAAPDHRRREFARGRACARQALQRLGVGPVPILRGRNGEPLWPAGIRGSITHCESYCAAVAARAADVASIGIDAETIKDLNEHELARIGNDDERKWIEHARRDVPWPILLFSAKESVFKAWFQIFGTALSFEHVHVEFSPGRQATFRAIVRNDPGRGAEFVGHFGLDSRHIFTCAYAYGRLAG